MRRGLVFNTRILPFGKKMKPKDVLKVLRRGSFDLFKQFRLLP